MPKRRGVFSHSSCAKLSQRGGEHAEIDVLRMMTLRHGLDRLKSRDLFDTTCIMWTNHIADGHPV